MGCVANFEMSFGALFGQNSLISEVEKNGGALAQSTARELLVSREISNYAR